MLRDIAVKRKKPSFEPVGTMHSETKELQYTGWPGQPRGTADTKQTCVVIWWLGLLHDISWITAAV